jgi:aldose 1-epimerase
MTRIVAMLLAGFGMQLAGPGTQNAWAAVRVSQEHYGATAAGQEVESFTLRNGHGMTVQVLSYGGVISEISVPDRHGRPSNVVLRLPDLRSYESRPNFSCVVGRYANRIAGGGFTLHGTRYDLPSNASGISSHGGPHAFGARVWAGRPFQRPGAAGVVLELRSADGDNGYPGNLDVSVSFTLTEDDALRLDYTATTDRATILNLTHHVYFNLAGAGTIAEHRLQVFAERYTPVDARKIPTGEIAPVAGTPLDFRSPTLIGKRLELTGGIDHNFVLDRPGGLAARVADPVSGRVLEVITTQPGLQVYTGNGFDGSVRDAQGRPLERWAGLALEAEHFPDSPNRPAFPSTVLEPGQVFRSTTDFRFSVQPR